MFGFRRFISSTRSHRILHFAVAIVISVVARGDELPLATEVSVSSTPAADASLLSSADLASLVTIYRDSYGTPHIDGETDAATLYGFAYAQAEDNFWQLEDNYILALGRYSEVHGPQGLNSDLLNRAFEIVNHAKANYQKLEPEIRVLLEAFAAGLNRYLDTHPQTKPRLITRFEPWQILAFGRHMTLEVCYRYTRLHNNFMPRSNDAIWAASGSNGWAISPSRTKSGKAML